MVLRRTVWMAELGNELKECPSKFMAQEVEKDSSMG